MFLFKKGYNESAILSNMFLQRIGFLNFPLKKVDLICKKKQAFITAHRFSDRSADSFHRNHGFSFS